MIKALFLRIQILRVSVIYSITTLQYCRAQNVRKFRDDSIHFNEITLYNAFKFLMCLYKKLYETQ